MKQALDMYQAENGVRLTSKEIETGALKKNLIKYVNFMYDCGSGYGDAEKACIKNYGTSDSRNSKTYKTYNKKNDVLLYWFDDGQFVLSDGTLVLFENPGNGDAFISVDINGFGRKPNQLGKDLFMFQLNEEGELLPMGASGTKFLFESYCSNISSHSMNGAGCTVKVLNEA